MGRLERAFEAVIWNSRFVVLFAVAGSLVASLGMFWVATVDTVLMIGHLAGYADPSISTGARKAVHDETVTHVVEIVDAYLLAAVLLIFALGLYELFVSRIDAAKQAGRVLFVRSLDDLKNRLGKVILMILVVTFFERVVAVPTRSAIDLLSFAGGVALVAGALWLSHASEAPAGGAAGEEDRGA